MAMASSGRSDINNTRASTHDSTNTLKSAVLPRELILRIFIECLHNGLAAPKSYKKTALRLTASRWYYHYIYDETMKLFQNIKSDSETAMEKVLQNKCARCRSQGPRSNQLGAVGPCPLCQGIGAECEVYYQRSEDLEIALNALRRIETHNKLKRRFEFVNMDDSLKKHVQKSSAESPGRGRKKPRGG